MGYLHIDGCLYKIRNNKYQKYYCSSCEFQLNDDACKIVTLHEDGNDVKMFNYSENIEEERKKFEEYWRKRDRRTCIVFGCDVTGTTMGETILNMLDSGM